MKHPERLQAFSENSVGLRRGEVRLVSHNALWKDFFSAEAELISGQLALDGLRLHHCGSTAIPGIAAKPILDIVGSVLSLEELDRRKPLLEEIGYEWKGAYGIAGRRYSVLYDPEKVTAFVHLHLFAQENPELERHLLFRDFLQTQPLAAKEYEAEKLRLVAAGVPRSGYSESKSSKISEILRAAESWKRGF